MGFGGSAAAMIASLKANKRKRVSTFDKIKDFKEGEEIKVHFKNKATPKQLKEIRERIQEENKKALTKKVVLISIFLIIIIYVIGFVKF